MSHTPPDPPELVRAMQEWPSCWHCPVCPCPTWQCLCREFRGSAAFQHPGHSLFPEFLQGMACLGVRHARVSTLQKFIISARRRPEGPQFPPQSVYGIPNFHTQRAQSLLSRLHESQKHALDLQIPDQAYNYKHKYCNSNDLHL